MANMLPDCAVDCTKNVCSYLGAQQEGKHRELELVVTVVTPRRRHSRESEVLVIWL